MEFEKLIEIVRSHPVLFDTSHADYKRSKMKDELWEKIGAELASNGKAVKEQWRKLRECHREALRRQNKKKSGDAAGRLKPWTYQLQMEFLLPYMKNRPTQSNLQNLSESGTPSITDDDTDNAAGEEEILPSPSKEESCFKLSEPVGKEVPLKKTKNRDEQLLLQQFIQSSERRSEHREELRQKIFDKELQCQQLQNDALYNFFVSMYATTKGLSPRYQRQVRNKVFEVVTQAEEQYEYETSQDAFSLSRSSTFSANSTNVHPHLS